MGRRGLEDLPLDGATALPAGALPVDEAAAADGGASGHVRVGRTGTLRLYLGGGGLIVGAFDAQEACAGRGARSVPVTRSVEGSATLQLAVRFGADDGTVRAQAVVG